MTAIKLSHSASTKYTDCPKSYQYHYIDKLRSDVQSSALLFGTAIDKAAEHYALTRDFDATINVFNTTWQTQNINGKDEDLRFLLNFTYSDKDLDTDLLTKEAWASIKTECSVEEPDVALYNVQASKSSVGFKGLSDSEKKLFNYANWLCLKRKGRLMLKEFQRVVDENVEEVLGTQVKVDLENDNGDSVVGFIDFIFKWKGQERPVIFDLKTAARDYDDDAVQKSPQLSLYVYSVSEKYDNTRACGFIVLSKNINKNKHKKCKDCGHDGTGGRFKTCDAILDTGRCNGEWEETIFPKAKSQILVESVSEVLVSRVIENFNEVNKAIKAEVFPRNFANCIRYNSIRCPYYDLCHCNKMTDITIKES